MRSASCGSAQAGPHRINHRAAPARGKRRGRRGRFPAGRWHKERPLLLDRVARYVREVIHEARKVVWLTYRQTVTYTVVVVVAVVVLAAFMYGFDALLGLIGKGIVGAA